MKKLLVDAKVQESAIDVVPYDGVLMMASAIGTVTSERARGDREGTLPHVLDDAGWEYVTRPGVTASSSSSR